MTVCVHECAVAFTRVRLTSPLALGAATVEWFTTVTATVTVETPHGTASGTGAGILSIPWSWPHGPESPAAKDTTLCDLVRKLAAGLVGTHAADPLDAWRTLDEQARTAPVPVLAAALAVAPLDNAVHDAWARACRWPAWLLYRPPWLAHGLDRYLGKEFAGRYPADYLAGRPRRRLPVQHVVGLTDPLTHRTGTRPLTAWLATDRCRWLKVKVDGREPGAAADRIIAVWRAAAKVVERLVLTLDPNATFDSGRALAGVLTALSDREPRAARAIRHVEQPTPPGRPVGDPVPVPVLADESVGSVDDLPTLRAHGYDGVALKAARGQSLALLSTAWTRHHDGYLAVTDLTAVGDALRHSARLATFVAPDADGFEYNSRQYAPDANESLARTAPRLVNVHNGQIVPGNPTAGLY